MITRTLEVDAKWDCISSREYVSKMHLVKVNIKDTYENTPHEDLDSWAQRVANEVTQMMCKKACGSLSDSVYCNETYPLVYTPHQYGESKDKIQERLRIYEEQRQQQLIKKQQAYEKEEKNRKAQLDKLQKKHEQKPKPEPRTVKVTIDEEPTTITFKKELNTMDVVHLSRLYKSIDKLEKVKQEQQSFLNMYNERIKSERIDLLLSSTKQRDAWQDLINITNIKIERQKQAVEKIKLGG